MPPKLQDATAGFYTVWMTYLGRRYGLLQGIGEKAATPAALGRALRLHRPAVVSWAEAAAACGLLDRLSPGTYRIATAAKPLLLDERGARYLAGQFEYAAAMSLDYERFDDLFREGRALPPRRRRRGAEAIEAATRWDITAFQELALPRWGHLRRHLEAGCRVLDVGCGAGAWMVRTARRFPRSRFVGIDPDPVALARARGAIRESRLGTRVRVEAGGAAGMTFRGAFDLAYLGEVLSQVEDPRGTCRAVARALKPSAHLVALEGIRPETPRSRDTVVLAMQLDQVLQGSRFFTRRELAAVLRGSGFRTARVVDLGGGLGAFAAVRA
jgi:SAM-dependent methyltransferase